MKMNKMMFMACCYNDLEMLIDPDTIYPVRPECHDDTPKMRFKPQVILRQILKSDLFIIIIILCYLPLSAMCPIPEFNI
jgi:hypothetical protein